MWKTISSGEVWHHEMCFQKKNTDLFWAADTIIVPF
jgi:hypothetical protein